MRFLLAMFSHETNTFSPVPTPLERFFLGTDFNASSQTLVKKFRGTGTPIAGFMDVVEKAGGEVDIAVVAQAWPSAPPTDATFDKISSRIIDAVKAGGYDGIMLHLHGAMVTESHDDPEGEILRRIRAVDPLTPIAVTLDMHANVFDPVVRLSTVVTGYHTYPHVDMYEAGVRAADALVKHIAGRVRAVMAWGNVPMLPHVLNQGTHTGPNKVLQDRCMAFEKRSGVLAASLFVGFPNADVENAGVSVIICTDGNAALAEELRDELLALAWEVRRDFVYASPPLQEAVASAKAATQFPVVMLDHCDNAASGGSLDSTMVLKEVIRQKLDDVVFFAIWDPIAVDTAIAAGIGNRVTLDLGGKTLTPTLTQENKSIRVSGTVTHIFAGQFTNLGPMFAGVQVTIGKTVVLDTGSIQIVIISEHIEPHDLNCLLSVGIDPSRKKYIVLKSRMHWRAGFGPLAKTVVECNGFGVTTSDYSLLDFKKLRRPMFPLDEFEMKSAGSKQSA